MAEFRARWQVQEDGAVMVWTHRANGLIEEDRYQPFLVRKYGLGWVLAGYLNMMVRHIKSGGCCDA